MDHCLRTQVVIYMSRGTSFVADKHIVPFAHHWYQTKSYMLFQICTHAICHIQHVTLEYPFHGAKSFRSPQFDISLNLRVEWKKLISIRSHGLWIFCLQEVRTWTTQTWRGLVGSLRETKREQVSRLNWWFARTMLLAFSNHVVPRGNKCVIFN